MTGCVSMQCCTLEPKWENWFIDLNMSGFLTEPDFKDRVVLHCLEKAGSTVQERSTNWAVISQRLHQEFISERHTCHCKFKVCLSTQLWPRCFLFVYYPCNPKMNRPPCPVTTNQNIKKRSEAKTSDWDLWDTPGSQISHFYADNIRWSRTELCGKLNRLRMKLEY